MIGGIFHPGSGLGDQLFRYITTRTLALDKGYEWGMVNPQNFKGEFFGLEIPNKEDGCLWLEKETKDLSGLDIRSYDPEINFVEDGTTIDGSFEDSKYWHHRLPEIGEWLVVQPLNLPDDLCVIGFRGGEYALFSDLFLPRSYWESAIAKMREINPAMRFQVHTDDPSIAWKFFPEFEIVENEAISHSKHTNMGFNWRSARNAKYSIIPNSAFFILPRLLKHQDDTGAVTIAPRYWARRYAKIWARPACYYSAFKYL